MTGRAVAVPGLDDRRRRRSWIALGLGSLALVALGVGIGSRIAIGGSNATVTVTVQGHAPQAAPSAPRTPAAPTRANAVASAATYVSELDGPVLLDPARLRALVRRIATASARDGLVTAYEQAASEARERLGVGTVPAPVVIVRAAPVGYRIDSFGTRSAAISIWRVGIVGSGATVEPQQSWRTERVDLLWERGGWKVASFSSTPGPTPPLSGSTATSAGDLFAAVPDFQEFSHAGP